ncbi:MAG: alpha/beta hydrolase [Nitrospinota bacterium]|nr:alpha/beta hydrolase [Nitrospinota bacterium]
MPFIKSNDIELFYEDVGEGTPILFVHEFAGDYRSWEHQIGFFSKKYRTITYNARGFPPSEVPKDVTDYSQDFALQDLVNIIKELSIAPCHVVGLSMGGFASLHLGMKNPELARSIVVAGCGYGSVLDQQENFRKEALEVARRFRTEKMEDFGKIYTSGPTRVQLERKNPKAYEKFVAQFLEHSPEGCALTMEGLQSARPSVYEFEEELSKMCIPTLILTGDEDEPCLEPGLFLKRKISSSALVTFPNAGHLINLEEPKMFNRLVQDFITEADSGNWPMRDERSKSNSALLSENS